MRNGYLALLTWLKSASNPSQNIRELEPNMKPPLSLESNPNLTKISPKIRGFEFLIAREWRSIVLQNEGLIIDKSGNLRNF